MAVIKIGELIKEQLHQQGKTVVWLAHQLSCSRNNVYKIFHSTSIASQELLRISMILDFDFFAIYSQEFNHRKSASKTDKCNQSVDM